MTKPWKWVRHKAGFVEGQYEWILYDGRGRNRANVWKNGVWHTWDTDGIGGENGACEGRHALQDAKDQVMAAVVRQGWTPWKVEYPSFGKAEVAHDKPV